MTEARVVYQAGFAEMGVAAEVAGDIQERCRVMLLEEPRTRTNYKYAYLRYLVRYCGLGKLLASASNCTIRDFEKWYMSSEVPDYRTVANRCQELMRADASLKPAPEIETLRQRQRRQGRVR